MLLFVMGSFLFAGNDKLMYMVFALAGAFMCLWASGVLGLLL